MKFCLKTDAEILRRWQYLQRRKTILPSALVGTTSPSCTWMTWRADRDGADLEMEIEFWNPRPTPYHQDNTVPFPPSPFIPKWLPGNCWLHRCCWLPANQITLLGMSQAQQTNPHGSGLLSLLYLAPSLKEAWKCIFKANPGHLS